MRNAPVILISDIHGNKQAMEAFDQDVKARLPDAYELPLIHCGDILDYGADPADCIDMLKKYNMVVSIVGNHDEAILFDTHDKRFDTPHGKLALEITRNSISNESIQWLRTTMKTVDTYEDIIAFHGEIDDVWANLYSFSEGIENRYESGKIYVFGHSHLQFKFEKNGSLFINPGSIGQPRNGVPKCHYAILYPNNEVELIRIDYDIDGAAKRIIQMGYPKFLATRLYLGI